MVESPQKNASDLDLEKVNGRVWDLPWIKAAKKYIGVKEIPGSVSEEHIAKWLEAVKAGRQDETPWCAAFVNGILKECGRKGTGKANARSFLACGESLGGKFKPGAIVVFWRGDKNGWMGHVGFAVDITPNGSSVQVLGGNQGDKVSMEWMSTKKILGFRWPLV